MLATDLNRKSNSDTNRLATQVDAGSARIQSINARLSAARVGTQDVRRHQPGAWLHFDDLHAGGRLRSSTG